MMIVACLRISGNPYTHISKSPSTAIWIRVNENFHISIISAVVYNDFMIIAIAAFVVGYVSCYFVMTFGINNEKEKDQ